MCKVRSLTDPAEDTSEQHSSVGLDITHSNATPRYVLGLKQLNKSSWASTMPPLLNPLVDRLLLSLSLVPRLDWTMFVSGYMFMLMALFVRIAVFIWSCLVPWTSSERHS